MISLILNAVVTNKILITEFLAINSSSLKDVDNEYSDWIELYNPGETVVDLTGWHLTDNASELSKWTFPSKTIGAGQYLIVFASGKDKVTAAGELHTNFKLSGSGEYLALVEADTTNISYEYTPSFPSQLSDISYGIYQGQQTSFATPTPGAANTMGTQIMTPVFSITRGFYQTPITVAMTVADATTKIYYTTDGTRPSATKGILYTGPITISKTTPLSAISVKGSSFSQIVTNTYFFIADIVNQSNTPVGYPTGWGRLKYGVSNCAANSKAPADYEMDPEVCNNPTYKPLMEIALRKLPTLNIVTNPGYLFSESTQPDTGGIYIYTGNVPKDANALPYPVTDGTLGAEWERPTSVEYFDPKDSSGFQINCGLRLHGGNSRVSYNSPKHGFTLAFKGATYGASKLNFDLFDEKKAVNTFNTLVLRAGYNFSWIHVQGRLSTTSYTSCVDAQYIIDPFAKKTLLDMDLLASHGKFVHLYINGLYWGVYEVSEKLNKSFAESYLGGTDTDYDVLNDDIDTTKPLPGLVDGDTIAFNALNALSRSTANDPYVYNQLISNKLLALSNYTDYMLMNFYIGNEDWDSNNWFTIRNRITPGEGFNFTSWDAESAFTDVTINKVTLLSGCPTRLFDKLIENSEYKMLLADRIQKHFFNGGALSETATAERYQKLASKLDTAIIGESARWGDYLKDVFITSTNQSILYTYNDHWTPKKNSLMANYFPQRTGIVFSQLNNAGLFPSLAAPQYNTTGGKIPLPFDLTLTANAGSIYYTIDGADPRLTGGAVNTASAKSYTQALHIIGNGTVRARAKSGTTWSALNEVRFKGGDTLHFVGEGSGLPLQELQQPIDIYYADYAIHYQLPVGGSVEMTLYTIDGRKAGHFEPGEQAAGTYRIEGSQVTLSSGIYLYRMLYNDRILTGKLIVP
jgi:hypothetical protein